MPRRRKGHRTGWPTPVIASDDWKVGEQGGEKGRGPIHHFGGQRDETYQGALVTSTGDHRAKTVADTLASVTVDMGYTSLRIPCRTDQEASIKTMREEQ